MHVQFSLAEHKMDIITYNRVCSYCKKIVPFFKKYANMKDVKITKLDTLIIELKEVDSESVDASVTVYMNNYPDKPIFNNVVPIRMSLLQTINGMNEPDIKERNCNELFNMVWYLVKIIKYLNKYGVEVSTLRWKYMGKHKDGLIRVFVNPVNDIYIDLSDDNEAEILESFEE